MLAPHPDDEVFGCGAAIASHVLRGIAVCVVVLTDGAHYGDAMVRQGESIKAAKVLGYGAPEFWNLPDRGLRYAETLVQRLVEKISQIGADLVYAPSPWEIHPDHRQAQLMAVEAIRRSAPNVRLAFYEVGVPLRPNVLLDIGALLETKQAAMRCFVSQLKQQDYVAHIQALNRFRTFTLPDQVQAAEAFWLVSANELDPSGWSDLLGRVSLGMRSVPPPLGASSPGARGPAPDKPEVPSVPAPAAAAPTPGAEPVKVCVLIRTINRPSLQDAIASVFAQSFSGSEIIVVNASGHPLTVLPAALSERVSLLLEPGRPLGRSAAANALLDAASSKYAVFLDDDDRLLPDHLHKLAAALEGDPTLVAAYSDVQATLIPGNDDLDVRAHVYEREYDPVLLQFQNYLPIHSVMFRLQAARAPTACRFDEELALFEDWDFWLQLARKGDFRRVPGVSALYELDAATGSGHAVLNGSLREAMLRHLGGRQLGRWNADDMVRLVNWEGERSRSLAQAEQVGQSAARQLDQARIAISDAGRSILADQAEIEKLGRLRLEHLRQLEQAQESAASLRQSVLAQQGEISELESLRVVHLHQLEQAQISIAELERQRQTQLLQLEQALSRIAGLTQIVSTVEQAASEMEQRLSAADANQFAQQLEIEKLGRLRLEHLHQLEEFNARLLAIHQSSSWRLTRPLRVVRRLLRWLAGPAPLLLARNGWRAVRGEIRRHDLAGFVRRLPHYARNRKAYGAMLAHPVAAAPQALFDAPPPRGRELRLHPDLSQEKTPIDASVSVVIPTFNAGPEFRWLLRKLRSQKGLRQLEIVIVDSGSQDETVSWARAQDCRVVEISQAEFNHSHARNLGAAHASADYLIFMVQDAYPIGEYWAYGMLRYLLDHADSGLVAASCSEYSRSDSDMMYDSMIDTHYRFLGCHEQDRIGDFQGADHMALRSRGQLSDVACLISRATFGKYGYRGDYAEDLDLGIRLIKDGHRVAMLASVKVVHSHNRPAYYYLKRSYVDVIFLVGMFDDFLIPALDSVQGLLLGIVSCAGHVSDLLPTLNTAQDGALLSQRLGDWIAVCRQQCGDLHPQGSRSLGDERLDGYIDSLSARLNPETADSVARSEARRFADSFFARLEHFNAFAAQVYGAGDALLQDGLKDAVRKTFAATAGSALGFMYMDRLRRAGPDQDLVDAIHSEIGAGV